MLSIAIDTVLVGGVADRNLELIALLGPDYDTRSAAIGSQVIAWATVGCSAPSQYSGGIIPVSATGQLQLSPHAGSHAQPGGSPAALTVAELEARLRELAPRLPENSLQTGEWLSSVNVVSASRDSAGPLVVASTVATYLNAGGAAEDQVLIRFSSRYPPPMPGETLLVPRRHGDNGLIDLRGVCHTHLIMRGGIIPALGIAPEEVATVFRKIDGAIRLQHPIRRDARE